MISPDALGGDEDLARRVLVRARSIAPCLDNFADDSEDQKNAVAILRAVMAEIPQPGTGRIRAKARNGTSISYADPGSWFSTDDEASLRSLCGAAGERGPVGRFPAGGAIARVWPEEQYS